MSWSCHNRTRKSSESQQSVQESGREYFCPTPRRFLHVSTNSPRCPSGTELDSEKSPCRSHIMILQTSGRSVNSTIHVGFVHGKARAVYSAVKRPARASRNTGSDSTGIKESKRASLRKNIFQEEATASGRSGIAAGWGIRCLGASCRRR